MEYYTFPQDNFYGSVFGIVTTKSGTYVCPGWHPVPEGTTREQIRFEASVITPKKEVAIKEPENGSYETVVPGSKPGKEYTVKLHKGIWSCTCPAASFQRGHCKHVKAEQNNLQIIA